MMNRFGSFPAGALRQWRWTGQAFARLGYLSQQILKSVDFPLVRHLLLFRVLDQFEDFLHVMQGDEQAVHDPFYFQDRLLHGSG
jgi:hypothetical protein